jgi:outer membrane protein
MKSLTFVALLALFTANAHAVDLKFAVVDMVKAFTEYHKTKDASERMKTNKDKALAEINERIGVYKGLLSEAQKIGQSSQDPILAPDARARKQAEYGEKQKEVRALEQEMTEFQTRRQSQLRQEEVQLQRGLYEEIVAVVREKAKSDGMDFVFDKTGVSMSTVPVLIYYKDAQDITDKVIVELNKNAPAAGAKPAEVKPAQAK